MLTEAVWWIHAHTKGMDWTVDKEIRDLWQADLSARTSLSAQDLLEGAVDVAVVSPDSSNLLAAKRWDCRFMTLPSLLPREPAMRAHGCLPTRCWAMFPSANSFERITQKELSGRRPAFAGVAAAG